MPPKLLVFDSHPVQYRVPIWQGIQKLNPGSLHVVYASDCSVKGHNDIGFGQNVKWDEPLLSGYENTVLNCENGTPLSGWNSLTGHGVSKIIDKIKPDYILLTGLNYKYDLVVFYSARKKNIPLWLRCETQDCAIERSAVKYAIRSLIYRRIYSGFNHFFYIGELNRQHYLKLGVPEKKLTPALYGTVNHYKDIDISEKENIRKRIRGVNSISEDNLVIGFSGKFIEKKNPEILFKMLDKLSIDLQKRTVLYFVGSGELENKLIEHSKTAFNKYGIKTIFAGFVNQSKIGEHYLAMDVLVLPSRKMGETWGLVVNEALQAGCGVIVTKAVGCSEDFSNWERFEIIGVDDDNELAKSIVKLAGFKRNFDWALKLLEPYSIEATVNSFVEKLNH